MKTLQPPFQYFGGKRTVSHIVWSGLGRPHTYCEPFSGGAAVLLGRPHKPKGEVYEILNDLDGDIINFWRAVKADPEGVWDVVSRPFSEIETSAWKKRLRENVHVLTPQLEADPTWYDIQSAGMWVYGQCLCIATGWSSEQPNPTIGHPRGVLSTSREGAPWLRQVSQRLQGVYLLRGDWERALSMADSYWRLNQRGYKAAFLDPPYLGERTTTYKQDNPDIASKVEDWCVQHESEWRICLAGYAGHYNLPGWQQVPWTPKGGFCNQGYSIGRENAAKETLWFSPNCAISSQDDVLSLL